MHGVGRRLFPSGGPEPWRNDPAMACSDFVRPLWLTHREELLPDLISLFEQASDFPWIYPSLAYALQWHVFLAGNSRALEQIDHLELPAPREAGQRAFSWSF